MRPGVTTDEIDVYVHDLCIERNSYPSPLNYNHFPKSVCTSVNEVICHGIPDSRALQDGDIVNIDVTTYVGGVHGDTNATFFVGNVDPASQQLVRVTEECMWHGIEAVQPGRPISDIGKAIESHAKKYRYGVVKAFIGHGIGEQFHTDIQVLHYYDERASIDHAPGHDVHDRADDHHGHRGSTRWCSTTTGPRSPPTASALRSSSTRSSSPTTASMCSPPPVPCRRRRPGIVERVKLADPALGARRELDRRIIALAIPALGTLAVEPLYVLVDTAIVGRLGTPQLGGLAIASTMLLTVISLTASLEYGVTPDVAFAHGAGRSADARDIANGALRLAVMIGVPMGLIVAVAAQPLAWLLGGRGDVLDYAVTYLRISCVGLPFVLIAYVGHGVMRGVNDLRKPLQIVVVANVVNVILEIVAVYWLDLGVAGSAWSTVCVQIGAAAMFLRVLRPHRSRGRPSAERMQKLLRSGVHFAVRSLAMFAVWNTATAVAARIDTPTLAAHQVLTTLFMFLALMLDALAIPAQSLVAGALGADDTNQALLVGRTSNRLSLWCATLLALVLAALSPCCRTCSAATRQCKPGSPPAC